MSSNVRAASLRAASLAEEPPGMRLPSPRPRHTSKKRLKKRLPRLPGGPRARSTGGDAPHAGTDPGLPGDQPVHRGGDRSAVAAGAVRVLPLRLACASWCSGRATRVPPAGGGASFPDRAVAGRSPPSPSASCARSARWTPSRGCRSSSPSTCSQMADVTQRIQEFAGKVSIGALAAAACYSRW
jgi:hypothetical protein